MLMLTCCADVAGGVRCPGDAVDTRAVVVEPSDGRAWHTHVQNHHLGEKCEREGEWKRERKREGKRDREKEREERDKE